MNEGSVSILRGRTLWIGVALVLSLAVNTFFLGTYVGGRAHNEGWVGGNPSHMGPNGPRGPEGPESSFPFPREFDPRFLARILPDEAQDEAMGVLQSREPEIRALLDAAGAARHEAFAHMHGEEFDRDAMTEALAKSRAADLELSEAVHATVLEVLAGLNQEQRAALQDRMDERYQDRRERRERFRGRREGRDDRREERHRDRDQRPE